jgi:ferredoxin/flavodoxin---NADP+ reductase
MTLDQIGQLRQKHYNATVTYLHWAQPELMILRVRPDYPLAPHKTGQYSTLGMGYWEPRYPGCQEEELKPGDEQKLVRRAYSISCSILDEQQQLLDRSQANWLEFYIVLVRNTETDRPPALTPRLFLLQDGGRLYLGEKIAGNYTLDPVRPDDTVVFLATGTGEAPHNYMSWELLRRSHRGPIISVCCVRYKIDLAYLKNHETLMERYANYRYLALTTREKVNVGQKVYIQDLLTSGQLEERTGVALDPARTHVYLCGNPKMIGVPAVDRETGKLTFPQPTGAVEVLVKRGFEIDQPHLKKKGNIHVEEYW